MKRKLGLGLIVALLTIGAVLLIASLARGHDAGERKLTITRAGEMIAVSTWEGPIENEIFPSNGTFVLETWTGAGKKLFSARVTIERINEVIEPKIPKESQ